MINVFIARALFSYSTNQIVKKCQFSKDVAYITCSSRIRGQRKQVCHVKLVHEMHYNWTERE